MGLSGATDEAVKRKRFTATGVMINDLGISFLFATWSISRGGGPRVYKYVSRGSFLNLVSNFWFGHRHLSV